VNVKILQKNKEFAFCVIMTCYRSAGIGAFLPKNFGLLSPKLAATRTEDAMQPCWISPITRETIASFAMFDVFLSNVMK
jgi:hypothetical protein